MSLENVLSALVGGLKKSDIELYRKLTDDVDLKSCDAPDKFNHAVLAPFKKFVRGCLAENLDNDEAEFLYAHYDFVERHLSQLFVDFEGSACSVDKSSHVISQMAKHFSTGDLIEFDYANKKAFWLPRKILRDHDSVMAYYKSLRSLYYGNPKPYLNELRSIALIAKAD